MLQTILRGWTQIIKNALISVKSEKLEHSATNTHTYIFLSFLSHIRQCSNSFLHILLLCSGFIILYHYNVNFVEKYKFYY